MAELRGEIVLSEEELERVARRAAELVRVEIAPVAVVSSSPFLTVAEAAAYVRAKPQRIYDLLTQRRLSRFKDGSRTLVSKDELDAHLAGEAVGRVAPVLPTGSGSHGWNGVAR